MIWLATVLYTSFVAVLEGHFFSAIEFDSISLLKDLNGLFHWQLILKVTDWEATPLYHVAARCGQCVSQLTNSNFIDDYDLKKSRIAKNTKREMPEFLKKSVELILYRLKVLVYPHTNKWAHANDVSILLIFPCAKITSF